MPTIECLVKRVGPTEIPISEGPGQAGIKYLFTPVPMALEGEPSTSICQINKEQHLDWMLNKYPNTYREYDAKRTQKELEESRKKAKLDELRVGISIEKYMDKGYVIVDRRKKKEIKYMDQSGMWKESRDGLDPFLSMHEADEQYKEEIAYIISDAQKPKDSPPQSQSIPWTDKIKAEFDKEPELTAEDILGRLLVSGVAEVAEDKGKNSVYSTLGRLVSKGYLVKTEEGTYKKVE